MKDLKTYTLEAFGAKADGVTNDAMALWKALTAAHEGGIVALQPHKTYYIAPVPGLEDSPIAAISLREAKNVTVIGESTMLLLGKPLFYCNIVRCENICIKGITFDYRQHPFAKATALSVDQEQHTAVIRCDRTLGIDKEVSAGDFAVLDRPDARYHMFTKTVSPVDAEKYIYKVQFSTDPTTEKHLKIMMDNVIIFPIPGFAHRVERGFSIIGNKNFAMEDCTVHSMARFGFALFRNEGSVRFTRFRAEKHPHETVNIVGWRDLFHVKENRAKFIWEGCYAEYCYDDIFNISVSTMNVREHIDDHTLDLLWRETRGTFSGIHPGDKMSFMDYANGTDLGTYTVAEIVKQEGEHNIFRFAEPVGHLPVGDDIKAHDDNLAAPGSEIKNCDFRGTFRFRGPIDIMDSKFYVARMWINLEMPVEGPVPKHIHFKNCTVTCDDDHDIYFHLAAQKKAATGEPQYHLEDITFESCDLPKKCFEIAESDRPYVTFS